MMSPETPPDPPLDNNHWSEEDDFTDSDPELDGRQHRREQHISPVEVSSNFPVTQTQNKTIFVSYFNDGKVQLLPEHD